MKKSLAHLLICVFALAFYASAQTTQQTDSGEASYALGFKLLAMGRAEDALPFLQEAVKFNGESYVYRLNAGRAAQFSGNFQPCVENLTEAMRLRPKEQTAQAFYIWRAECNMELGKREAAQSDFTEAAKLQPGLKWAYSYRMFYDNENVCQKTADEKYNLADTFYKDEKIYEAYRELHIALKCDPKHLPSLKLRLKIESADDNLSAHAKIHRIQLEKIENPNYKTFAAMTAEEKRQLITPNTTTAATTKPTSAAAMEAIVAGKGWNKVIIGASQAEVESVLGKPEKTFDEPSFKTVSGSYFSKGIALDYDRQALRVVWIRFIGDAQLYDGSGGSAIFQSFQGKPDKSLLWGASVSQITGAYGTPADRQSYADFKTKVPIVNLSYSGIKFIFKNDRLFQIDIVPESKATTQAVAAQQTTPKPAAVSAPKPPVDPNADNLGEANSLKWEIIKRAEKEGFTLLKEGVAVKQSNFSNNESLGVKQSVFVNELYQFVMISKDATTVTAVMIDLLNSNCSKCSTSITEYSSSVAKSGPTANGYYLISYQLALTGGYNNYAHFIPKGNRVGENVKWLIFHKSNR